MAWTFAGLRVNQFIAKVVKRLGQSAHRILGVYRANKSARNRDFGGGRVEPADRKARHDRAKDRHHRDLPPVRAWSAPILA